MQARGTVNSRVHINEFLVGEQAARRCLALDLPDSDLTWADTSSGRHRSDEVNPDRIKGVVEAGCRDIERDYCRYLFRVGALEACITSAV